MSRRHLTTRQEEARQRGFAAINRVRRGQSKTLTAAARAEGTSVGSIRRYLPAALMRTSSGRRIRVKAGDPYSARVELITDSGRLDAKARGSRQRQLAGRHRAVALKVLQHALPPNALEQFRGTNVGGHELISDGERLFTLAAAGVLSHLDSVYVSPGPHA